MVFLGGKYGRMWCFSMEELQKFFGIAKCVSIPGLGDRVVRMDGLSIGGLWSKVAASVVLSQEEREWSENESRRANLAYHETGRRWSSLACCKRYVDELLLISKMWCYECLEEMIPHVYTVQFGVEPQAAIVSCLDRRFVLETSEIWAKEKTYRISPPFASDFRLLRAFVIGRLKRLDEVSPPVEECVRAVCDLLSDAVAAGWNKKVLRAIGYSVRSLGTDLLIEILRKAVKVMIN